MKRHDPSSIAIVLTGLFLVSLAMAGCAGSTSVDSSAATIAPLTQALSTQVPNTPTVASARPTQVPDHPTADAAAKPAGSPVPVVLFGDVSFDVELAETSQQVTRGLSGRDSLPPGTGMLFVHKEEKRYTFWMKDMRFPLDMIWIDARCTVADISAQVPAPDPGQSDRSLPLISPNTPVLHVLEINAGVAAGEGVSIGDAVEFAGSLKGRFGC